MFHENSVRGVAFMTSDLLPVKHGFTTRCGGVSTGIYASLNLRVHCDDTQDNLRENYRRTFDALEMPQQAVFSHQVHGNLVRPVTAADTHALFTDVSYEADGLVTDVPGLPLIIFTADCVPILLADGAGKAVAAVHAGWRGTALDIAGEAVRQMERLYGCVPADIRAAIGPSIGPCCFETGPEVPAAMTKVLGEAVRPCIIPRGEKAMVDLKGINRLLLLQAGLTPGHIDTSDECTMCRHNKYWSHRYTRGQRGTQGSVIML